MRTNINKNVLLLLTDDTIKEEELKINIRRVDDKIKQMLLWSAISSAWGYFVLIVLIARLYISFQGRHPTLLTCSLLFAYIAMGSLIFSAWKRITSRQIYHYTTSKSYLIYQINKVVGQRKLIALYLLEFGLLSSISGVFFMDVHQGVSRLVKLTIPVSTLSYIAGIYFLVNFTRQIKKLKAMKQQFDLDYMNNLHQN